MLKILELFGGIGACSSALDRLGIEYEIADYVEIDKYATMSYNAIHNTSFDPQDIKTWDKNIKADFIMHGSPCQDFSVAGKQAGGDIGSGTRSSLMYETIRIIGKIRPKYVLWENVKNILSPKHKHNFQAYIDTLKALGYNNYYQVLNAKNYGVPQNRERVFTISIRRDVDDGKFVFPEIEGLKTSLKDILEAKVDEKYYLKDYQIKNIEKSNYMANKRRIQKKEWCDTLCARDWKDPKCIQVGNLYGGKWDKTNESCRNENDTIRKITPRESWRLMGFTDDEFEKAQRFNSNTQLYKQAGNSIVVNVLEKILQNLFLKNKEIIIKDE